MKKYVQRGGGKIHAQGGNFRARAGPNNSSPLTNFSYTPLIGIIFLSSRTCCFKYNFVQKHLEETNDKISEQEKLTLKITDMKVVVAFNQHCMFIIVTQISFAFLSCYVLNYNCIFIIVIHI